MTCDETRELITGLLDGELLDAERASLESHLRECPDCRLAVEQEKRVKRALHASAERVRAPGALRDRILSDRRIFPEKNWNRWQDYLWPKPRLALPALAVGLILSGALPAFFLFKPNRESIVLEPLKTYRSFSSDDFSVRRP